MTEYELSQLPASEFGKRGIKRVSPVYDKSFFYKKFLDAIGQDEDRIRYLFESLREQRFIQTVEEWGIKYLEMKYSVPIIRTDDLETRRARLGIKAFNKTPLNPAILEKYALDNYGLRTYLDESEPGIIGVNVNEIGGNLFKFIEWLLRERPAHLMLKLVLRIIQYVDSDTEFILPDRVIKEPPLPRTHDDKKNFPRLFTGNFLVRQAKLTLPPEPPLKPDLDFNLFTGAALLKTGRIKIPCALTSINHLRGNIFAGGRLMKTSRILIK